MQTNRFSPAIALSVIAALAIVSLGMIGISQHASLRGTDNRLDPRLNSRALASNSGSAYDQVELVRAQRYAAQPDAADHIELMRAQRYESAAAQQAYLDQRHGEWSAAAMSFSRLPDLAPLHGH